MPSLPVPVFVAAVWAFVAPMWTPFLAAERVRALFDGWPTGRLWANYGLVSAGVVLLHATAFLVGALAGVPVNEGVVFFEWLFALNVAVPAAGWLLAVVVLPATGREWDPTGHGVGTAALLGLGAVWYAVLTTVVLAAIGLLAFLIGYPG